MVSLVIRASSAVGMFPAVATQSITSLNLTSTVGGNQPFMVGHAFKKGDVPSGTDIITDTAGVTMDYVPKRRWNDGSLKHAILVGHADTTANVAKSVNIAAGQATSGTLLTSASIQAAAPTATVQLGALGTASLASLLASPFRTWVSTSQMVECHYRTAVTASLTVWFHVRLWSSGRMWVRAYVENGFVGTTPGDQTYTATVTIGGTQVFNSSITHYQHSRWDQEGWIGVNPGLTPSHNVTYLGTTKTVPNYWKKNPSATKLNALVQTYTPMNRGPYPTDTSGTGFQEGIGQLPLWDALYCTSGDIRAYRAVVASARAYNCYALYRKNSSTNRIPRPSDFPTTTYPGGGNGSENVSTNQPTLWDVSHAPNGGFLAYLVTGDYYFYETMAHEAQTWYFNRSTSGGTGVNRNILGYQNRGVAWGLNVAGGFCAIAPNEAEATQDNAVVTDYQTWLSNVYTNIKSRVDAVGQNLLGIPYAFSVDNQWTDGIHGGVATWMTNFWVGVNGRISDLEPYAVLTDLIAVRDYMYKWIVGTLGPTGVNNYYYAYASNYGVVVDPTAVGTEFGPDEKDFYDSWGSVFNATHLRQNNETTTTLQGGSGGAPANAPTGYWGNLMPAIAHAVDHSATGALAGFNRMTGASNWNTIETSGFDDTPIWGIVPRTVQIVSGSTALATSAATLGAGQCRLFGTISSAILGIDGTGFSVLQYAGTGVYDATRKEASYIGKRSSNGAPYRWLLYDEVNNTWSITSRAVHPSMQSNQNGHGYDHHTHDGAGTHYVRQYDDENVHVWNDTWGTNLAIIPGVRGDAAALAWFNNKLYFADCQALYQYTAGAWSLVASTGFGNVQNHTTIEVNTVSNVLLFGSGNNDGSMRKCTTSNVVSTISTPPFNIGTSESQGLFVADPTGIGFIAWERGSNLAAATSNWRHYNPNTDTWSTLTQSVGSGASPQNGTPPMGGGSVHSCAIKIPEYNVIMYIHFTGSGANVWLYRHT